MPPQAPEYLSIRYYLARLYRTAGQPQRTREIAGAVLAGPELARTQSNSAQVLFAQERFATAVSRDDAVPYLQRWRAWLVDRDTLQAVPAKGETEAKRPALAADGLIWLNDRLAVADLLALARDERLARPLRASIAIAAWYRADLLGQRAQAEAAARLAQDYPLAQATARAYLATPALDQRRHLLVLAGVRHGLSAQISPWAAPLEPPPRRDPGSDEPTASMWCRLAGSSDRREEIWNARNEQVPPPPDLAAEPAARDREIAALRQVKTATGFVGAHVLARARSKPNDPDLPWLLHVVVQSTRGGCLDPDSHTLSRSAHQVLHSRFPNSEWARKTPYWY